MKFGFRLIIIPLGPLAAVAVLVAGRIVLQSLPENSAHVLATAHRWLVLVIFLYLVNFLVAWWFRESWIVFVSRALAWALVAYLCISNTVDLFGENSHIAWQILGAPGQGDPVVLAGLRGQLYVWIACLVMAIICIGIGFESVDKEEK